MDLMFAIVGWILFGLVVGVIARLLVPGSQPIGTLATIGLGVLGSVAGGYFGYLFSGGDLYAPAGWIGSILCATLLLVLYVMANRRSGWGMRRRWW